MKWVLGFLLVVCMAGAANAQSSSTVSGNSLVMANFATHLNYVYATNQTSTAGFLMALNATTVPADGPVVPLDCVALAANATASISDGGFTPASDPYSIGLVVVVSSGANCFTKTTGTITAFIKGYTQ